MAHSLLSPFFYGTPSDDLRALSLPVATIENIHEEFKSSADILLKEAEEILEKSEKHDVGHAKNLIRLGFTNAREVRATNEIIEKRTAAEKTAARVVAYRKRHPRHAFMTEERLSTLCAKYGLVFGPVGNYLGHVPAENAKEMENFRLLPGDAESYGMDLYNNKRTSWHRANRLKKKWSILFSTHGPEPLRWWEKILLSVGSDIKLHRPDFLIAAPKDQFNTRGMEVRGYQIFRAPEDPIVLCAVEGGYLVVTAWGPEDEEEKL